MALVEVYEVASFYAHFDIVLDGEEAPPKITVRVCDSLSCALAGAEQLLEALKAGVDESEVRVVRAPCMGGCHNAPVTAIGHSLHEHATVESVKHAVEHGHTHPHIPDYLDYDGYVADGGYKLLGECLDGTRDVDSVIKGLEDSGIRGLGGAGFPTGRKWRFVRAEPGPRLMAINGDEGEPGTFKDRHYLERDPHRFLEGMLIGAWAVEATDVYIYLRDEYPQCREILLREIAKLEAAGLRRTPRSISAAARAPISAAKSRRCSKASRASAAFRATSRRSRPWSACSAARRSSTMSKPSSGSARSWKRAAPGSPATAPTAAPACAPSRCRAASRSRASSSARPASR